MAGITSTKKIIRQQAAFGGIMGKDGRKAYVGGSYAETSPGSGKERGTYQGRDDSGGYGGTYSGGGSDSSYVTSTQNANNAAAIAAGKKAAEEKRKQEIRDQIAKSNLEKSNYGKAVNVFDYGKNKLNQYNRNYKKKQLARYQRFKIDELNAKLAGLENFDGFYGDTNETYADFINNYAPSITEFGPPTIKNNFTGTGKYSQKFIDDVLSGKRAPPQSFSEIDISKVPGGMYGKGAAAFANMFGKGMAGPTTKEELMDIYTNNKTGNSYTGARDFDVNFSTGKEMMKIFEPNRYKLMYGDGQPSDDNIPFIPINYNTGAGITEDVVDDKEFVYRFGTGQKVGADVLRGYVANGGRITRAGGGIMNAVPRQGYFLGGIGKAIKGVVGGVADAAKKVLKSPLGQAAIIGLGGYYAGGGNLFGLQRAGATGFGSTGFGALAKSLGQKALLKDGTGPFTLENLSLGKLGILGASALPFFMKQPEDPDIGMSDRGGSLTDPLTGNPAKPAEMRASLNTALANANGDPARIKQIQDAYAFLIPDERLGTYLPYRTYGVKDGGRIGKAEGGLMDLGGMEKDYRAEGGFVPIGREEKADDVPARLSVNEFVFTADAVRNAGGGDIDKGAEVMENMMKNLENGGTVSEESQGNTGAQEMFSVSERIGEVI
jgi:hypothetical protein